MFSLRVAPALISASVQLGAASGIGVAAETGASTTAQALRVPSVQAPTRPSGLRPATASAYKVIASFTGPNGKLPEAAPIVANGMLYGTTRFGGSFGYGTVYKASTSGAITIIHNFASGSDGAEPFGRLLYENGRLYGATRVGGKGYGTVFAIGLSGGEQLLRRFVNADGSLPFGGLAYANGFLYGTTAAGGAYGQGTVFKMTTSGASFQTLHSFNGNSGNGDGVSPYGDLIAVDGSVYGTTAGGGTVVSRAVLGTGTVFVIDKTGRTQILHVFSGYSFDGHTPYAGLTLVNGLLYGATFLGGDSEPVAGPYNGFGTIYRITSSGTQSLSYSFGQLPDAQEPGYGSLTAIGSVMYGATSTGGGWNAVQSLGTVFSFDTRAGVEKVLHTFVGYPTDGAEPLSCGLANINGTLYGTTYIGGTKNMGTIFAIAQ